MAITYDQVKSVASELYGSCLMKIPEDTKGALKRALDGRVQRQICRDGVRPGDGEVGLHPCVVPLVGLELLVTRQGAGTLALDGKPLPVKGARPLPASD